MPRTEKNASLHQGVNELRQKIAAEQATAAALRERALCALAFRLVPLVPVH